jgi:MFS family permease
VTVNGSSGRLWRERDFVLFWGGQAVSLTGSAASETALPLLAVLILHAGPVGLGVLQAAVYLPFLGLPLLAGVYADRHRRRPIMLSTNAVRFVLLAMVAVLAWTHTLSLAVLCIVVLVAGSCGVFFEIAEIAYVPALVGRDRLLAANSAVQAANSGAELAGPGLAGLLVQAFGAPAAVAVDAASYAWLALTLAAIRQAEPRSGPPAGSVVATGKPQVGREVREGLRFLWRTVPVRVAALQGMAFNAAWQAFNVPYLLYAIRDRHISVGWWGAVLALGGGASMLGAMLAPRLATRLGYGRAIIVVSAVTIPPVLLIAAVDGTWRTLIGVWSAVQVVTGFGVGLVNVMIFTMRADLTPNHLLGRVGASARLLVFGALPLGALIGGLLADHLGNRPSMWLTAIWQVATIAMLYPLWRLNSNENEAQTHQATRSDTGQTQTSHPRARPD